MGRFTVLDSAEVLTHLHQIFGKTCTQSCSRCSDPDTHLLQEHGGVRYPLVKKKRGGEKERDRGGGKRDEERERKRKRGKNN